MYVYGLTHLPVLYVCLILSDHGTNYKDIMKYAVQSNLKLLIILLVGYSNILISGESLHELYKLKVDNAESGLKATVPRLKWYGFKQT